MKLRKQSAEVAQYQDVLKGAKEQLAKTEGALHEAIMEYKNPKLPLEGK